MNRKFIYIGCTVFAMSLLSMTGVQAQEESKDSLVNVAFGKVAQEDLTHAISTVNTSELTKKTANNNSLVGLESFVGGYNGSSLWGQGPLVLVDGVPRSASSVKASEVESISMLKDAAAVVLYGRCHAPRPTQWQRRFPLPPPTAGNGSLRSLCRDGRMFLPSRDFSALRNPRTSARPAL